VLTERVRGGLSQKRLKRLLPDHFSPKFCRILAGRDPVMAHDSKWKKRTIGPPKSGKSGPCHKSGRVLFLVRKIETPIRFPDSIHGGTPRCGENVFFSPMMQMFFLTYSEGYFTGREVSGEKPAEGFQGMACWLSAMKINQPQMKSIIDRFSTRLTTSVGFRINISFFPS
jgi:hypothetical protein